MKVYASEFGTCEHGNAIHFGYPCECCEAKWAAEAIERVTSRGEVERELAARFAEVITRVQRYERGRVR